nr:hypothetical protein BaRGS_010771 [Batillaria attramentaria]
MTILLEILQTKKKITDGSQLVPVCFNILTRVLELESQGEAEYLKQLLLGVIYNLCHKHSPQSEPMKGSDLNMEAIVQCIRTSDNPHTHQQALLVLSVAAKVAPEKLLHSMMSVFTFMGANILRQDDSYSFHVITRILETVFPALVMACEDKPEAKVTDMVTMVLRVFVDTYPHIPEHRKLMLFSTLMKVVGVDQYMWRLLLVFIEGVAVRGRANMPGTDSTLEQDSKPLGPISQSDADFLVKLVSEFSPQACLQMAHDVVKYLLELPADKTDDAAPRVRKQPKSLVDASAEECDIFSLAYHTAKQLRHFKYATVYTLSHILSSGSFVGKLSESLTEETMDGFRQLLEVVLQYITHTSRLTERFASSTSAKFWRVLLNKCHDLLDNLVTLLPQDHFLSVVSGLMDSHVTSVQRKAMELLSTRLQHMKDMSQQAQISILLDMVRKLQTSVKQLTEASSTDSEESAVTGQTALYTLKLLCRTVLQQVCEVLASRTSGAVLASAMLCAAEVVSCVRAHAIVHLPRIVPPILKVLQAPDTLDQSLATGLPSRIFIPVVTTCYEKLLEEGKQESVECLLAILEQHISQMSREDLNSNHHQLLSFFLSALDFRVTQRKVGQADLKSSAIDKIEGAVITTILSMVLKMSEATFRPMLLKIFEWATLQGSRRERVLVFYRLADSLVEKLRSLFLLFAAHIIKHAAQLLDAANTSKTDEPYFKKDKKERKVSQLLTHTLGCLHKCFLYDSENFINKERFDLLLQPLIDQTENFAGGEEAYTARIKECVVPAIASFAAAVHNDSLWKTLNYQLLLKTRHSRKEVRLSALAVLEEFHKKLGEDYLPLLPETIPFLAELMEG